MRLLLYWLLSAVSLVVSAFAANAIGFDVQVDTESPLKVLLGTAVLGLVNVTLGTVLKLLTGPTRMSQFRVDHHHNQRPIVLARGHMGDRISSWRFLGSARRQPVDGFGVGVVQESSEFR